MGTKTIKISEENYRWLVSVAGELQAARAEPVSIDKTLSTIRAKDLKSFAGAWKISEKEAEELKKRIRDLWQ